MTPTPQSSGQFQGALVVSRRVLRGLVLLNGAYGLGILVLLVASLVAEQWVMRALGVTSAEGSATLVRGMRVIMVAGIASVPIAHVILGRLLAIVDTVRDGDPFVLENGARLQMIAWLVLGLELLHLIVGAIGVLAGKCWLDNVHPRAFSNLMTVVWAFAGTYFILHLLLPL